MEARELLGEYLEKDFMNSEVMGKPVTLAYGTIVHIMEHYHAISSKLENLMNEVDTWQRKTFGSGTPLSKLAHLKLEIEELANALHPCVDHQEVEFEYADCFLLLFGSAMAAGYSFDDITELIREKHAINTERKWGEPDENGVVKHIKDI